MAEQTNDDGFIPNIASVDRPPQVEWLKMTKGQLLLGAFLYFSTVEAAAVSAALKTERKAPSKDEVDAIGRRALAERAERLGKDHCDLSTVERLDLAAPRFRRMTVHFQNGLGFVHSRLGLDGPRGDEVWGRLPEPRVYFTTLLLVYATYRDGQIDRDGEWRLVPWRFGTATYNAIWEVNDGLRAVCSWS